MQLGPRKFMIVLQGGIYWSLSAVIIGYVLLQAIKKFSLNMSLEEPSLV